LFLFVTVDDFNENTGRDLVLPKRRIVSAQYDADGNVTRAERVQRVKHRKHAVDWRTLAGLDANDVTEILDPNTDVDLRDRATFLRRDIVALKA
jgi:hypothetical protein